jgi:hypothetical protein
MTAASSSDDASLVAFVEDDMYAGESLSLDAAFGISAADIKHVNTVAGGQKAVNYGEVTLSSWIKVLDTVKLAPEDVFVDLGSGRGLLAMFTQLRCKVRRSVGVELSKERHAMACKALAALRSSRRAADAPGLAFVNDDIRTCDCLDDATFVFLMNQARTPWQRPCGGGCSHRLCSRFRGGRTCRIVSSPIAGTVCSHSVGRSPSPPCILLAMSIWADCCPR